MLSIRGLAGEPQIQISNQIQPGALHECSESKLYVMARVLTSTGQTGEVDIWGRQTGTGQNEQP